MYKLLITALFCTLFTEILAGNKILVHSPAEALQQLASCRPGDTVLLAKGTYLNAVLSFHVEGNQAHPIVFAAEEPGAVFFEGDSYLRFSGTHIVISGFTWRNGGRNLEKQTVIDFRTSSQRLARFAVVQHCYIDRFNNNQLDVDNKWVSIHGSDNTLAYCRFYGKANLGATVTVWLEDGQPARHQILRNHFWVRTNGPNASNGLESLRIGDSKTSMTAAYCEVRENLFEACDGEIEVISNKSCFNSYIGNTFRANDGGLTLRHGNDCLVSGNYFDGAEKPLSYGVRVIGERHRISGNFFMGLRGGPRDRFRAALTVANGVPDPALNSYWQVKGVVISKNQWVDCAGPAIRIGAGKKEAILLPEEVQIDSCIVIDTWNQGDYPPVELPQGFLLTRSVDNLYWGKGARLMGWNMLNKKRVEKKEQWLIEQVEQVPSPLSQRQVGPVWMQ